MTVIFIQRRRHHLRNWCSQYRFQPRKRSHNGDEESDARELTLRCNTRIKDVSLPGCFAQHSDRCCLQNCTKLFIIGILLIISLLLPAGASPWGHVLLGWKVWDTCRILAGWHIHWGGQGDVFPDFRFGDSHAKVPRLFDTQIPGIAATSTDRVTDT